MASGIAAIAPIIITEGFCREDENAKHTTQMPVGWPRLDVTKALCYKESRTLVFSESLRIGVGHKCSRGLHPETSPCS